MPATSRRAFVTAFAWTTAALTLLLICSGGMVTSKNAGLAVPDWPNTFGYNMFLFPPSKWIGGILFEHTHRLLASTVGFLTIILAALLWWNDERAWVRRLGFVAIGAVILQGVLGGLRVTLLKDQIGIAHAAIAHAFFCLLVLIALARTRAWAHVVNVGDNRGLVRVAAATSVLIYVQLLLGATMRHQHRDLSIVDFPTAYGRIIPDTSTETLARVNAWRDMHALSTVTASQIWLQMAHRAGAVLVAVGVITFWSKMRARSAHRRLATLWVVGVFVQITLGAWTIWSNKAADVATAHVAVGAVMLALGVTNVALLLRSSRVAVPALAKREFATA